MLYYRLKINYLHFLKRKKKFFDFPLLFFLYILSLFYYLIVFLKNFFYDSGLITEESFPKKIISVGNLSWGGSGKTPLAIYLYEKLSQNKKVAILRRGYGEDENFLFKERGLNFYSHPDRLKQIKAHPEVDIFILDDGFQYRKLKKDIEIVLIKLTQFNYPLWVIPFSIFREPFSSLKRADILIINRGSQLNSDERAKIVVRIKRKFSHLKTYFLSYKFFCFKNFKGEIIKKQDIARKRVAALCAIAEGEDFINLLKCEGIIPEKEFIYPDHYLFSVSDMKTIFSELERAKIKDIVITSKDKFKVDSFNNLYKKKFNFYILEIDLVIENEDNFLKDIYSVVNR